MCESNSSLMSSANAFFAEDNFFTFFPCTRYADFAEQYAHETDAVIVDTDFPNVKELLQILYPGTKIIFTSARLQEELPLLHCRMSCRLQLLQTLFIFRFTQQAFIPFKRRCGAIQTLSEQEHRRKAQQYLHKSGHPPAHQRLSVPSRGGKALGKLPRHDKLHHKEALSHRRRRFQHQPQQG